MSMRSLSAALVLVAASLGGYAAADDLFRNDGWASLASDRTARAPGDVLTVLIYETSSATQSAQRRTKKTSRAAAQVSAGSVEEAGRLSIEGGFDGTGQSGRAGRVVGQISVRVDQVLPNGDLRVSGRQQLTVDGERTWIRLRGIARRADVSADNTVLSARLAEAVIDFEGKGFAARGARPGALDTVLSWLGLL